MKRRATTTPRNEKSRPYPANSKILRPARTQQSCGKSALSRRGENANEYVSLEEDIATHTAVPAAAPEAVEEEFAYFCDKVHVDVGATASGDTEIGRGMIATKSVSVNEVISSIPSSITLSELLVRRSVVGRCVEFALSHPHIDAHNIQQLLNDDPVSTDNSISPIDEYNIGDDGRPLLLPGQIALYAFLIYHRFVGRQLSLTPAPEANNLHKDVSEMSPRELVEASLLDATPIEGNPALLGESFSADSAAAGAISGFAPVDTLSSALASVRLIGSLASVRDILALQPHSDANTAPASAGTADSTSAAGMGDGAADSTVASPTPLYACSGPSFWSHYCRWMPATYNDPLFWPTARQESLLRGSNLYLAVQHRRKALRGIFDALFPRLCRLFPRLFTPDVFTFQRFLWAHCCYSSRSFPGKMVIAQPLYRVLRVRDWEDVAAAAESRAHCAKARTRTRTRTRKHTEAAAAAPACPPPSSRDLTASAAPCPETRALCLAAGTIPDAHPALGVMFPYLDLTNHRHRHPIVWLAGNQRAVATVGERINAFFGRANDDASIAKEAPDSSADDYLAGPLRSAADATWEATAAHLRTSATADGWVPHIVGPVSAPLSAPGSAAKACADTEEALVARVNAMSTAELLAATVYARSPTDTMHDAGAAVGLSSPLDATTVCPTGSLPGWRVAYQSCHAYAVGEQVFNNYGPKSNEELLLGYGFVVSPNPDEHVAVQLAVPATAEDARTLALAADRKSAAGMGAATAVVAGASVEQQRVVAGGLAASLAARSQEYRSIGANAATGADVASTRRDGLVHYLRMEGAPLGLLRVLRALSLPRLLAVRVLSTTALGFTADDLADWVTALQSAPLVRWSGSGATAAHHTARTKTVTRSRVSCAMMSRLALGLAPSALASAHALAPTGQLLEWRALCAVRETVLHKLQTLDATPLRDVAGKAAVEAIAGADVQTGFSATHEGERARMYLATEAPLWLTAQRAALAMERAVAQHLLRAGDFVGYCAVTYRCGQRAVLLQCADDVSRRLLATVNIDGKEESVAGAAETATAACALGSIMPNEGVAVLAGYLEWRAWVQQVGGMCYVAPTVDGQLLEIAHEQNDDVDEASGAEPTEKKVDAAADGATLRELPRELLRVPRKVWLGAHTMASSSSFGDVYRRVKAAAPQADEAVLLALFLLHEWHKGRKSKWFPFFHALCHPSNADVPFSLPSGGEDADSFAADNEKQVSARIGSAAAVLGHGVLAAPAHLSLFALPPVCTLAKSAEEDEEQDEITVKLAHVSIPGANDPLGVELEVVANICAPLAAEGGMIEAEEAECELSFAPAVARLTTFREYYCDIYAQIVAKLLPSFPSAFPAAVYTEANFLRAMHIVEVLGVHVRNDTPTAAASKSKDSSKGGAMSLCVVPIPFRLPAAAGAAQTSCMALCNASAQTYTLARYKVLPHDTTTPGPDDLYMGLCFADGGVAACGLLLHNQPLHVLLETPLLSYAPVATHVDEPAKGFSDPLPVVTTETATSIATAVVGAEAQPGAEFAQLQWWATALCRTRGDASSLVDALCLSPQAVDEEVELSPPLVHSTDDLALRLGGTSAADEAGPMCSLAVAVEGTQRVRVEYRDNPLQTIPLSSEFILDLLYHVPAAALPPVLASVCAGYSKDILISAFLAQISAHTVHLPSESGRRVDLGCYGEQVAKACADVCVDGAGSTVVQLLPLPLLSLLQRTLRVAVSIAANDDMDANSNAREEANEEPSVAAQINPVELEGLLAALYAEVGAQPTSADALVLAWAAESLRWQACVESILRLRAAQHAWKLTSLCGQYPDLNVAGNATASVAVGGDDESVGIDSIVYAAVDFHAQQLQAIASWCHRP